MLHKQIHLKEIHTYYLSILVHSPFGYKVPPKIQPFSFGDEPLSEGQATSVSCLVSSGDLPLAFSWFLNGEQIDGSDDILISQTGRRISQLSIDAVDHKHMGNYSCVASNNASSVTYSAELMVNG